MRDNSRQMGGPEGRRRSCLEFLPRGDHAFTGAPHERGWIEGLAECLGERIGLIGMLDRDKQERNIDGSGAQLFSDGPNQFFGCRWCGTLTREG